MDIAKIDHSRGDFITHRPINWNGAG